MAFFAANSLRLYAAFASSRFDPTEAAASNSWNPTRRAKPESNTNAWQ
jgi:hypothetical protein